MIFTNFSIESYEKEMSFGKLWGFHIGEYGRGRKEVFIPTPGYIELKKGINSAFSIGQTKTGKCRINSGNSADFFILSSQGGYTRRGNGTIKKLKTNPFKELDYAYGADGAAGRIGSWYVVIGEFPITETWIRIKISGGNPSDLVHWDGSKVIYIKNDEINHYIDMNNLEIPFKLGNSRFDNSEWDC